MWGESLEKAQEVFKKSKHSIDDYRQEFVENTWHHVTRVRLLEDLVNDIAYVYYPLLSRL